MKGGTWPLQGCEIGLSIRVSILQTLKGGGKGFNDVFRRWKKDKRGKARRCSRGNSRKSHGVEKERGKGGSGRPSMEKNNSASDPEEGQGIQRKVRHTKNASGRSKLWKSRGGQDRAQKSFTTQCDQESRQNRNPPEVDGSFGKKSMVKDGFCHG